MEDWPDMTKSEVGTRLAARIANADRDAEWSFLEAVVDDEQACFRHGRGGHDVSLPRHPPVVLYGSCENPVRTGLIREGEDTGDRHRPPSLCTGRGRRLAP